MKKYKVTGKQIEDIKTGLNKFIKFAEDYSTEYKRYFDDMEETNRLYMENPNTFFDGIGTSNKVFFDKKRDYELSKIAKIVLDQAENIHVNIICIFINPDGTEYPAKVREWLYEFKKFCFEGMEFLSLEKQNEKLKEYVHFDASAKRPTTYKTQVA